MPAAPVMTISIPLMSRPIDKRKTVIVNDNLGYSNNSPARIATIIPITIFEILTDFPLLRRATPVAVSPIP